MVSNKLMTDDAEAIITEFGVILDKYDAYKNQDHIARRSLAPKFYLKLMIWLEKIKDSLDENEILMYCRGLVILNQIHSIILPLNFLHEDSNILHELLISNNSFALNLMTKITWDTLQTCFLDIAIEKDKTNTFIYYNKWVLTNDIKYLIKSADNHYLTSYLYLMQHYTLYNNENYNLDLAVDYYNKIQKYYVNNHVPVIYYGFVNDETLNIIKKRVRELNDHILGEYEIVCDEVINLENMV